MKISRKVRSAIVLLVVGLAISGCTHTLNVPLKPAAMVDRPAGTEEIPIAMGLYYSPEFLAHEYIQVDPGGPPRIDTRFPFGQASAEVFDSVLNLAFAKVQFVDSRPPLAVDGPPVVAVIEPRIAKTDIRGDFCCTWGAEITYLFRLLDRHGSPLMSWTVVGSATTSVGRHYTGMVGWVKAGENAEKALEDAGRKLFESLYRNPELVRWLEEQRVESITLWD